MDEYVCPSCEGSRFITEGYTKNSLPCPICRTDDAIAHRRESSVDHPSHYNAIEGIECIDVARHFSFNLGCVIKYLWRHEHKGAPIEDLKKAQFYLANEIERLEGEVSDETTETI